MSKRGEGLGGGEMEAVRRAGAAPDGEEETFLFKGGRPRTDGVWKVNARGETGDH